MAIPAISRYSIPSGDFQSSVQWKLAPKRAALLIHDMQNYFISPYDLSVDPMKTVIPHIQQLITAADSAGIPVFYSAQPPRQQEYRRGLLSDMWGQGIQTDEEAEIIEPLAPKPQHHVVTKWRYSAFNRTDLRESLAFGGCDQLLITGVYGHMGCKVTAVDAFMSDVAPFLVSDAIADFTAGDHEQTLAWVSKRCGRVITTQAALAALTSSVTVTSSASSDSTD